MLTVPALAGVSALVLGVGLAMAPPVPPASVATSSVVTSEGLRPAPPCVDYRTGPPGVPTTEVHIRNWCSHTVYVRVDVGLDLDSECVGVRPATVRTTTVVSGAQIRGIVECDHVIG